MGAADLEWLSAAAARAVGVDLAEVLGTRRTADVSLARQIAMVAARSLGYTLTEAGAAFGRNHTTVLHAERRVAALVAERPEVSQMLRAVLDTCPAASERLDPVPAATRLAHRVEMLEAELAAARLEGQAFEGASRQLAKRCVREAIAPVALRRELADVRTELKAARRQARHVVLLRAQLAASRAEARAVAREVFRLSQRDSRRESVLTALRDRDRQCAAASRIHVGEYTTRGTMRSVDILLAGGDHVVVDACGSNVLLVERLTAKASLAQIAAVAEGYLGEARRVGRPTVHERFDLRLLGSRP